MAGEISDGAAIFRLFGEIGVKGGDVAKRDIKALGEAGEKLAKTLTKMAKDFNHVGTLMSKVFTVPLAAAGSAVAALALKTGAYASELMSMSEATGLSTDALQEYEQVARAAGVSSDAFLAAVQKLSPKLTDIQSGTGEAAVAMDKLGISVTNSDGSLRSMDDLLPEIIGSLNKVEDVNQRNAIASDIFGKKLKDVAPILSMTSEQLDAVRKSAHDTGKVMSEAALKDADQFRLSVDNLKKDFSMLGMQIGNAFIPILRDQLAPMMERAVSVAKQVADKIKDLTAWFNELNPLLQKTVIILGGVVAAAGPALLIAGKFTMWLKGLLALIGMLTPAISALITIIKGAWVVLAANPGLIIAALASLGLAIYTTIKAFEDLKRAKELAAEADAIRESNAALMKQVRLTEQAVKEYEKLKGTKDFDPAELERLTQAHYGAVVAIKEHSRAAQGLAAMTDAERKATEENVRAKLAGVTALKKTVDAGKEVAAMTDLQRARLAKEAEERQRAAAARRQELNQLVDGHNDAYTRMQMDAKTLIDYEEELEIEKAKKLGAREKELTDIRRHYDAQRQKLADEAAEKEAARLEEERLKLEEEARKEAEAEEKKLKEIEELHLRWDDKLTQQKIAGMENRFDAQLAALEVEAAKELAVAAETGADSARIEEYYANERKRINAEAEDAMAAKRKQAVAAWTDATVGAVNKIGSVMSMFSANDEKRLSKEYKDRRAYIEANIDDEEERKKRLAALDDEEDAKKLRIQKDNAARDKAIGIFSAAIDTARAVVKALAEMGPIVGPIMAATVGALGAAQVTAIATAPEPFEAGALIQGGRGGVVGQIGEGRQDELILPMETGVDRLADRLIDALGRQAAPAAVSGGGSVTLNLGAFIGNDAGLRELERRLRPIRAAEIKRTGGA